MSKATESLPEPLQVVARLITVFEPLGIEYLVGGSVASSATGIERATQDVDFVVDLDEARAERLAAALADDFYADADLLRAAARATSSANVIHLATMVKADLFVMPDTPFARSEMARRIRLPMLGDGYPEVCIASAEDMVLQKLRWYRQTGERSDRQWGDVLGILRVQGAALDFGYLDRWAQELGVDDLLERIRSAH